MYLFLFLGSARTHQSLTKSSDLTVYLLFESSGGSFAINVIIIFNHFTLERVDFESNSQMFFSVKSVQSVYDSIVDTDPVSHSDFVDLLMAELAKCSVSVEVEDDIDNAIVAVRVLISG